MSAFIGLVGFLAFIVGLVMLIISYIKKKSHKKPMIILLIGFLLFVIGISFLGDSKSKESKKTETSTSVSTADTKKDETKVTSKSSSSKPKASSKSVSATPVTFEELVKAYQANGAAADDTYKGKVLEFQGTVSKVAKAVFTGTDVTIDAGNFTDNQFMNTTVTINMPNDIAKKLTSGQTYTFQAKLNDATIMDSGWVQNLSMSKGTIK
ncbi:OB-fold protein [Lactococcus lactis subsp. lactis]